MMQDRGVPLQGDLLWDPPSDTAMFHVEIAPGLYQMQLQVKKGEVIKGQAWVLVTSVEQYEEKCAAYARLLAATSAWRTANELEDPSAYRVFSARALRAIASDPTLIKKDSTTEKAHE